MKKEEKTSNQGKVYFKFLFRDGNHGKRSTIEAVTYDKHGQDLFDQLEVR
jgi:hypothetical protein